jgi:hypothetical protein
MMLSPCASDIKLPQLWQVVRRHIAFLNVVEQVLKKLVTCIARSGISDSADVESTRTL